MIKKPAFGDAGAGGDCAEREIAGAGFKREFGGGIENFLACAGRFQDRT